MILSPESRQNEQESATRNTAPGATRNTAPGATRNTAPGAPSDVAKDRTPETLAAGSPAGEGPDRSLRRCDQRFWRLVVVFLCLFMDIGNQGRAATGEPFGAMLVADTPLFAPLFAPVSDPITEYSIEIRPDGLIIRFPWPMAIDRLSISAIHSAIWGAGRQVWVAVARTDHRSAVWGLHPGEATMEFPIADPSTQKIEVDALLTRPSPGNSAGELRLEGTSASRRRLELDLKELAFKAANWQSAHQCFCCHRVLPLALAVSEARSRRLALPWPVLASLSLEIVHWQREDGSFSFPDAPEYGVVTPTLCGAAVMAWMRFLSPTLEPALLRAVTFLISLQQPDGSVVPDFTFPPLMIGRPFAAWLFEHSLIEVIGMLEQRGFSSNPRLNWALQRVRSWLDDVPDSSPGKVFFALLAAPDRHSEAAKSIEEARSRVEEFQHTLNWERDPELFILAQLLLQKLRGTPSHPGFHPGSPTSPIRRAAWEFLAGLLQEP